MTGFVYFAECGGYIKIGYSADVKSRLRALNCGTPQPVTLIRAVPGTRADEAALHASLATHRAKNEWFFDNEEVRAAIGAAEAAGPALPAEPKEQPSITQRSDSDAPGLEEELTAASDRLVALAEHPLIASLRAARQREQKLGLARGSLMNIAMSAVDAFDRFARAVAAISAANKRLTEIIEAIGEDDVGVGEAAALAGAALEAVGHAEAVVSRELVSA